MAEASRRAVVLQESIVEIDAVVPADFVRAVCEQDLHQVLLNLYNPNPIEDTAKDYANAVAFNFGQIGQYAYPPRASIVDRM